MADACLFVGWKDTARGREAMAGELFQSCMTYYGRLAQNGVIESFEPVMLHRHGGQLNGFFILRGDKANLHTVRHSDEFENIVIQAVHCLDGFGVVDGYMGRDIDRMMGKWMTMLPKN